MISQYCVPLSIGQLLELFTDLHGLLWIHIIFCRISAFDRSFLTDDISGHHVCMLTLFNKQNLGELCVPSNFPNSDTRDGLILWFQKMEVRLCVEKVDEVKFCLFIALIILDQVHPFVSVDPQSGIRECQGRSEERRVGKECRSRWSGSQ